MAQTLVSVQIPVCIECLLCARHGDYGGWSGRRKTAVIWVMDRRSTFPRGSWRYRCGQVRSEEAEEQGRACSASAKAWGPEVPN